MLGFEPLIIATALFCGMSARAIGFPALIGYLAAGFALHEIGAEAGPLLDSLAGLGVTLMLFTIGLKLEPAKLLEAKVWGTTLVHMTVTQIVVLAVLLGFARVLPGLELGMGTAAIIAFGFTFSSTVFVIQTMQERGEGTSSHAELAIGILIIQDLAAVGFLAVSAGKVPEWEAIALLLIIPLRPLVLRVLTVAGYGELLTLCGLAVAIGAAQLSDSLGVKGDLGALALGAILAGHPKSKAMAGNLIQLKDLFLIGFFLSIGLAGWPEPVLIGVAIAMGLLAALKPLLYFPLMTRFHTPPRVALLASGALANHSEFGLIVVSVASASGLLEPQWTSALSIAIAVSFVLAAPISSGAHGFYARHRSWLLRFSSNRLTEALPSTEGAEIIILGMGRVGTGAYESLAPHHGRQVLGVEAVASRVQDHLTQQRRVIHADASDPDFWYRIDLASVRLVMLALTNHQENLLVGKLLLSLGYRGEIAAVVRHSEHAEEMRELGISAFNLYGQAGAGFAAHAADHLDAPSASG